ncbi:MAG: phBC6A51 family helix-turn-helix protein [Candidatus Moraniibacteriota bacterium]
MSNNNTTKKRTAEDKKAVLEQLAKLPIVQVAVQKAGVSRATYYRWRIADKQFAEDADEAIEEGVQMINDLSESQLISAIKNNNFSAVRFWLQNRHRAYANKVEVFDRDKSDNQELTDEQKKIVEKALQLASASPEKNDEDESRPNYSTTD